MSKYVFSRDDLQSEHRLADADRLVGEGSATPELVEQASTEFLKLVETIRFERGVPFDAALARAQKLRPRLFRLSRAWPVDSRHADVRLDDGDDA